MWHKTLFLIIICYFLALIQNSFWGISPNLILILICLLVIFEKKSFYLGITSAIFGGMFLDILSKSIIGVSAFSFLVIYFLAKEILNQLANVLKKYSIFYFIFILLISIIVNDFLLSLLRGYLSLDFIGISLLIKITYSIILGAVGFLIFKLISRHEF